MIAPQHRIYASFFLFAVTTGALMARLPDIQTHLGISEGQLGLTMIGMAIGSLIALTFGPPVVEKLGFRKTALLTVLGPAVLFSTIPWLPVAPAMFIVLFFAGLLAGALEINRPARSADRPAFHEPGPRLLERRLFRHRALWRSDPSVGALGWLASWHRGRHRRPCCRFAAVFCDRSTKTGAGRGR
jgi:MFS family permease